MVLRGAQCELRPWRKEDAMSLVHHANNRKVWRNLQDSFPHPYTLDVAHAWIDLQAAVGEPAHNFAVTIENNAIGGAGFIFCDNPNCHAVGIGYWLGEAYWGRGIATEVVSLLVKHGFCCFSTNRLFAGVYGWNPASARVLEKSGFSLEGRLRKAIYKDGEYVDELVYGLLRDEFESSYET